jgi:transposase
MAQGHNPRLARRASIILACLDGASNRAVAGRFRVSKQAVGKWRARFQKERVRGLLDQPRSGAPRRIHAHDVERVIAMTRQPPPDGMPRWTTRSMARACGLSQTTVNRVWRLHGLAPHREAAPASLAPPSVPAPARPAVPPPEPAPRPDGLDASHPETSPEEASGELIVELRRDLAGLAQRLSASDPAALRVAVDALEAALAVAAGSADVERRHGTALAPEIRARHEARWKRARAMVAEAKAALAEETERPPAAAAPGSPQPRR